MSRVPRDIDSFCPRYAELAPTGRKAFWAGLLSAVAKHESTYNPKASGGGGKWLGLMQIAPATWRSYGCSGTMTMRHQGTPLCESGNCSKLSS